jgi:hypothetical protein
VTGCVRIGISGWNYKGWRGVWYPKGLPHRRELEFASHALNSMEINGSFRCNYPRAISVGAPERRLVFSSASKARVSSLT